MAGKRKRASEIQKLDSAVAKMEGGKTQASMAKVRSVRKCVQKYLAANPKALLTFLYGVQRMQK